MLLEMQRQQLEPKVISSNAAMSACEKGEQRQWALGVLSGRQRRQLELGRLLLCSHQRLQKTVSSGSGALVML